MSSESEVAKPLLASGLPCTDKTMMENAVKANKTADRVSKQLMIPFAMCIAYVYALRVNLKESDMLGLPIVFSEQVSYVVPSVATVMYFLFIYFGNKYMADREPMQLKNYMVAYNLYQALLNIWGIYETIKFVYTSGMSVWGNSPDTTANGYRISFLIWMHYNNKYVELLDTVFMVLRKKSKQISFLHCYHHCLLIWSWFLVLKICGGGGDSYFGATVNSFIHVLMYTYYLVTLLGYKVPRFIKSNLTKCQMVQFMVCASHSIWCITSGHQVLLASVQLFVMSNMLVLFGNFYIQSYMKKKASKATKKE